MFLLDTNVISELRKPAGRVAPEVVQWVSTQSVRPPNGGVQRLTVVQEVLRNNLKRSIGNNFISVHIC